MALIETERASVSVSEELAYFAIAIGTATSDGPGYSAGDPIPLWLSLTAQPRWLNHCRDQFFSPSVADLRLKAEQASGIGLGWKDLRSIEVYRRHLKITRKQTDTPVGRLESIT